MTAPRFLSLWAINGPLDQTRLRHQIDKLKDAGLDGVVFHPRFFSGKPPYLDERYLEQISGAILHAKSAGMAFWIYDEDGWPSGTVSGQLLKKYPADAQRWVELVTEKPARCLVEFQRNGQKWFLAERTGAGVDYFNSDFTRHFIELTHKRYQHGLSSEAWAHVEAIFSDEPEFGLGHAYDALSCHGAIPWTSRLPEIFRQRFGEDLLPQISGLFFSDNVNESNEKVRVQFWELLTDLFNSSFTAPINDWCRQHGKLFTAHVKGEEHPLFQVPTNGSCHQFFRNLSLPGIDALERYPANNFYPRQVSSAARQFGNGRCMVEAFGGAGWGATPEDLENYLLWLGRHGLTDFALHLSQYRLDSAAMCDWPPSQPLHLTWREVYPEVLRRVRRELEENPRPPADTLIVVPQRGIMADYEPWELLKTNVHNAATYPDTVAGKINRDFMARIESFHAAGVKYDVADERTLEEFGKIANGQLGLGNCQYRHVVVDEGCRLKTDVATMVRSLTIKAESLIPITGPVPRVVTAETKVAVQWELEQSPLNSWLLDSTLEADGRFVARFECPAPLPDVRLTLVFADEIAVLSLNGKQLSVESSDEGSRANISGAEIQNANTLQFSPLKSGGKSFVWLQGFFRVQSGAPFVSGPSETIQTDGPFTLQPVLKTVETDLVAAGFPFLFSPLSVTTEIELPSAGTRLKLAGAEAAAIRLAVDGQDHGWSWRMGGEFSFVGKFSAGTHHLKVELIPNTFNYFGPHHYYGGDWFVVSPDQIKGARNFADPVDAPEHTHITAWNFRRFQLPEFLMLSTL